MSFDGFLSRTRHFDSLLCRTTSTVTHRRIEPGIGRRLRDATALPPIRPEGPVRDYKMYLIRRDGHVKGPAVEYVLQEDSAAIKKANRLAVMHDVEIWEGARLVAYVVADETRQMPPSDHLATDQHK